MKCQKCSASKANRVAGIGGYWKRGEFHHPPKYLCNHCAWEYPGFKENGYTK